jgi:hypothetical protein
MVSHGPLAFLTRLIERCDRREHRMVDRKILIQVRYETPVADAHVDTVIRRLLEGFLPVAGDPPTAVAMVGKRLVVLLQRVEPEVGQRRLVRVDDLKELRVRLFYFVFAVLLYNIWRLTDFLLKADIGGKMDYAPVLTAGESVELVCSALIPPD